MKFSFGANWKAFSARALNDERIDEARTAFDALTDGIELKGKRFLDVGYGQGLALFLAMEKGARVFGIDSDPLCEEALALTHRHFPGLAPPEVRTVSILDRNFIESAAAAGGYDIVHSWGVLHHTGDMQRAFGAVSRLVGPDGTLILAIYNQHWSSPVWKAIKILYNHLPPTLQEAMFALFSALDRLRRPTKVGSGQSRRGMSRAYDLQDWMGGYPYEYAHPEKLMARFARDGFTTIRTIPSAGWTGCNQFVFRRSQLHPTSKSES